MVGVVCPKCGLKAEFAQGITVDDPMKCEDLRGTRIRVRSRQRFSDWSGVLVPDTLRCGSRRQDVFASWI